MRETVIPPPPQPALRVMDSAALFPVRRIYCVGQNYAEHAKEMGHARAEPFFFTKPADAVFEPALQGALPFPPLTANLHHEVEWVIALGAPLHKASPEQAAAAVWGHTVGLDLTRRDLQAAAKTAGRPWDMAKGFDHSAVLAPLQKLDGALPTRGRITLSVNGQPRQQGDLSDLIWSVPELLAELSRFVALQPGDLVFTGTPAGVGPLQPGDVVLASIDGLPLLRLEMAHA